MARRAFRNLAVDAALGAILLRELDCTHPGGDCVFLAHSAISAGHMACNAAKTVAGDVTSSVAGVESERCGLLSAGAIQDF